MCAGAFRRFAPFAFNRRSAIEGLLFFKLVERELVFAMAATVDADAEPAPEPEPEPADSDLDVDPRLPMASGVTAVVFFWVAALRGEGDGESFVCIASNVSAAPVRPLALGRRCRDVGTVITSTVPGIAAPSLNDSGIIRLRTNTI